MERSLKVKFHFDGKEEEEKDEIDVFVGKHLPILDAFFWILIIDPNAWILFLRRKKL